MRNRGFLTGLAMVCAVVTGMAQELQQDVADELSRQATDPTASLMSMQFIGGYVGRLAQPG